MTGWKELFLPVCVLLLATQGLGLGIAKGASPETSADLVAARSKGRLVLQDDFSQPSLENWLLEGAGTMEVVAGALVVKAVESEATIWHKQRLYGDVLIEFDAHIDPPLAAGNLNAFVHATDPSGQPVYEGKRSGAYADYHKLPLYIFTFTGDQVGRSNATGWARFRKDPGFSLLAENPDFEAETGESYQVSILVEGGRFRYYLNGELVHDFVDPEPYRSGWFAFRTWNTNLTIKSLTVRQLREFNMAELSRTKQEEPMASSTNLISNWDFSGGVDAGGLPVEWSRFGAEFTTVVDDQATVGTFSAKIADDSASKGGGIRSLELPTKPGTPYRVEVDALPMEGRGVVYLDFRADGKRVSSSSKTTEVSSGEWESISVERTAPAGADTVSVILYSFKPDIATVYFDNVRLYDLSAKDEVISNRQPQTNEIGYRPQDAASVETNPPSFVWLPETWAQQYVLEYSSSPDFTEGSTRRVEGLKYAMYLPTQQLTSSTWYWRYWGLAEDGSLVGPSHVRQFTVTNEALPISLPPVEEVRARISQAHPRLFVTPEQLAGIKERWSPLELSILFKSGYLAGISGAKLPQLQPSRDEVTSALNLLQELGVLFVATGEEKYAKAGRDLLLHMTKVEPMPENVPTGVGKDAIFMALLTGMSRGYDWLYDALSDEERATVLTYLRDLGTDTYQRLRTPPFEATPFNSHPGRIMGFLGELAIATMGEIPEAEKWFDFVIQVIYNVYPAWGGADGGWSEGASYWAAYMNFIFDTVDAVEMATGVKLYQKPFFQNTGYYKLYTHPPFTGVPFGDGLGKPVDQQSRVALTRLAEMTGNGHFTWYAEATGGTAKRGGIVGVLVDRPLPEAKSPEDLPLARWFSDVGLVTMHTDLVNPENNVAFQLRSSPYGSASHSHADQNSFVLYAYGDGVAISSGYYPWSQSAHHSQWTNQTLSKNAVLINGEGQRTFDMDAKGKIENFIHRTDYDYTVGEAGSAYTTDVDSYRRHVVFIRPDLFVVVDDVRTPTPSTIDWLLHSSFPITWDQEAKSAFSTGSKGQLDTYLISDQKWSAAISSEFVPPPEMDSFDPQWHLTLSSPEKAKEHRVVAILVPNKAGQDKSIQLLQADAAENDDDLLTINLVYLKDGTKNTVTVELDLTEEGIGKGPVVR